MENQKSSSCPILHRIVSGGGKRGSRKIVVAREVELLIDGLLMGLGSYHHEKLPKKQPAELLQHCVQCSVMVFSQGLYPFHKTTKQLLVHSNIGSFGGDGVVELVLFCQVSCGQVVLSRFRRRPRCRQVSK
jgi:hypothetical protein